MKEQAAKNIVVRVKCMGGPYDELRFDGKDYCPPIFDPIIKLPTGTYTLGEGEVTRRRKVDGRMKLLTTTERVYTWEAA